LLRRRTSDEIDRKAWASCEGLDEKMKVPWGWLELVAQLVSCEHAEYRGGEL
jgi:hypothetical protein